MEVHFDALLLPRIDISRIRAYVNLRTTDEDARVSGTTWLRDLAAIKQFYEWLGETHLIALPFTLDLATRHTG